jgi:hypothetical protein
VTDSGNTIRDFLRRCSSESVDFSQLSWRQMEELVAELLKLQGMEVTVTPPSILLLVVN